MRSRCSGVRGGNLSTTARMCSASAVVARSEFARLVVLVGACAVGVGRVRASGRGSGESVALTSGAVVACFACFAIFLVLLVLSGCFARFDLSVGMYFPFFGSSSGAVALCEAGAGEFVDFRVGQIARASSSKAVVTRKFTGFSVPSS